MYCARGELREALDSAGAQYMTPTGRGHRFFGIDALKTTVMKHGTVVFARLQGVLS